MQKLLVICGPTGTGKTALGIKLARKFAGEIVSADSRQVYRGLDIATGKDKTENFKCQISNVKWRNRKLKYWKTEDGAKIWLVDVVEPTEKFSIATYQQLATLVLSNIWQRGSLPIVVGGTGLYIKALVDGIDTINVPPNPQLRSAYAGKDAEELFDILLHLDPEGTGKLNSSERKNKQRLIRRIEIAQARKNNVVANFPPTPRLRRTGNALFVGLTTPHQVLRERIEKRIDQWVVVGAEDEVAALLDHGVGWDSQAMSSIGYREWQPYFEGQSTKKDVIAKWKQNEWQYAKRQLTWFKKDKRINWFDITSPEWEKKVEKLVGDWYYTGECQGQ